MKQFFLHTLLWSLFLLSPYLLTAQVFVPLAGVSQVDCGTNTNLIDHGGSANNYANNADGYTIVQTLGTAAVTVAGNYTLGAGDQIIIYNGAGVGGTVLNTLTGNGTYSIVGTPGQQITVRFISDAATVAGGFDFTVTYSGTCIPPGTNMPILGSITIPCASNLILYDDGGGAGNYSNLANGTAVLTNDGIGIYTLSGTYNVQSANDFIRIYEGVGTGGTLLQTYTGVGNLNYSTLPGQTITIQFTSSALTNASGFALNISHYGGCSCPTSNPTASASPTSICSGDDSQLDALGLVNPSSYQISQPAYAPLPCSGTSLGTGPVGDDVASATMTMPFDFDFFGQTYNQFGVTSNGIIQFGPGPYSTTYTPSTTGIPSTSINNIIALNFADWWADAGDITIWSQGTAPNRRIVVCFNTLHPYPDGTPGNLTGQIVLYEGSNIVDLILTDSWMDAAATTEHLQTQGLQASLGVGVPVPGRNATDFGTINNSTMRFTPTLQYTYQWDPPTFLNSTTSSNPLASSMTSTTNYTLTASVGTICNEVSSVLVTVDPTPTVTIGGAGTTCAGEPVVLTATASAGATLLWSTGETTSSITVSPVATTAYNVIATSAGGGCSAIDNHTIVISGSAPFVNLTASPAIICSGQSTTLTANGGGTYLWNTGETTSSITYSPLANTTYSVTVTNAGCVSSESTTVIVSAAGAPLMTCLSSDTTIAECNAVYSFPTPTAIDACTAGPCAPSPISSILADFNANGAAISSAILDGYNFTLDGTGGATGTTISDGGNDMYDTGNRLNTNLGTAIPYTGGVVSTHAALGGGSYFTHKSNGLFVMAADLEAGVTQFQITGGNGADGNGTVNGFVYTVTVGCLSYDVYVKRIFGTSDPSINHVFILPSGSGATHAFPNDTNDDLHTLSGIVAPTRLYYLLFAGRTGTTGTQYTNAQVQTVVQNFLTQLNTSYNPPAAAAVTQIAGPSSGSTFPVGTTTVTFQATGAGGGTTDCSFDVTVLAGNAPIIICPNDTIVSECDPIATFAAPPATDPCGVGPCAPADLADILANFNANGAAISAGIRDGYNFTLDGTGGATGTSISDGTGDMYDTGNELNTNLATLIPYTGGAISTHAGFGGGSYFTRKIGSMFVMAADLAAGVTSFEITGNLGADGSGTANGIVSSITIGCLTYDVFAKRVFAGFDPSINHIFIVPRPNSGGLAHTFSTDTNDDLHTLTGLGGATPATRLYYLMFSGETAGDGTEYSNVEMRNIVTDFLTQVGAAGNAPSIPTVTQIAGPASGSTLAVGTHTVTYRATSLISGLTRDCSFDIVVQPAPVPTISGATSFCPGGNTTLVAAGGTSYLWSTAETTTAITVSPASNTTYSVTATDVYACTGTNSANVTLDQPSTPPVATPMPGTYCPNTTLTLNAGGGTAGSGSVMRWYSGANGTGAMLGTGNSITVLPTATTTTYYVRREGTCNNTSDGSVVVDLKTYVYGLNGAATNQYCTDNAGWHHFFNGNEILLSIQGDMTGFPAGSPTINIGENTTYYQETQGPFTPASCAASSLTPGEERFEMERSWNVDIGAGTLNPPYNVRFYYQPAERTAIENAAINHMATYPACGYTYKYANPQGFYWFKNVGSNYTAPMYDGTHLTSTATNTTFNGINYDELTGIASFSGGAGAVILIPDPLLTTSWLYFNGSTDNKINYLRWATEEEKGTVQFNVQRSEDGINFETIGMIAAKGQSSTTNHYTFDDINPFIGPNYYRLEAIDQKGEIEYTHIILLVLNDKKQGYVFYPNPTNDVVFYQYEAAGIEELEIEVIDVLGRTLKTETTTSVLGINNISIDLQNYPVGSYLVKVSNKQNRAVHTAKIIKGKL